MDNSKKKNADKVLNEFSENFDEYVFCMSFATKGIHIFGKQLASENTSESQQSWIATDCNTTSPNMRARMNTTDCIDKCSKDGHFSNEIMKSLLCTVYALWDEVYRHRLSEAIDIEPRYIECPLMGDLRKVRHCIIHSKSTVPVRGFEFEELTWELSPGKLTITYDMFLELNDLVKKGMRFCIFSPPEALKELFPKMTNNERKSFDEFFKNRDNRIEGKEWPGLAKFLERINCNGSVK